MIKISTQLMAYGKEISSGSNDANNIIAADNSGVTGQSGQQTDMQALIDAIADRVMTKLLAKNQVINNLLATQVGNALDATQGKALKDEIDELNDNLGFLEKLNNTLITSTGTHSIKDISKYEMLVIGLVAGTSEAWEHPVFIPRMYFDLNKMLYITAYSDNSSPQLFIKKNSNTSIFIQSLTSGRGVNIYGFWKTQG